MAKKKQTESGRKPFISWEDFIRAWQVAASIAEVCQATGMNERAVVQRAYQGRKRGIPLKRMSSNGLRKDWQALAKLAQELAP